MEEVLESQSCIKTSFRVQLYVTILMIVLLVKSFKHARSIYPLHLSFARSTSPASSVLSVVPALRSLSPPRSSRTESPQPAEPQMTRPRALDDRSKTQGGKGKEEARLGWGPMRSSVHRPFRAFLAQKVAHSTSTTYLVHGASECQPGPWGPWRPVTSPAPRMRGGRGEGGKGGKIGERCHNVVGIFFVPSALSHPLPFPFPVFPYP